GRAGRYRSRTGRRLPSGRRARRARAARPAAAPTPRSPSRASAETRSPGESSHAAQGIMRSVAALDPKLTDLSLADLRRRRSAKWAKYPEDVLPAWVAEMDFPLAEPVETALSEAVRNGDTGYAAPAEL